MGYCAKVISKTQQKHKKKQKQKQKILVSASHLLVTINCSSNFAIYCAKVISKTQTKTQKKQKQKQKNPCVCLSPSRHHKLLKQLCNLLCKGDIKNTKTKTKTKTSLCLPLTFSSP